MASQGITDRSRYLGAICRGSGGICKGFLIANLVASAAGHIQNPFGFLSSVYSYDLLGVGLGQLLAAWLPFWLLALAVAIVTQPSLRSTWWATIATGAVFVVAQGTAAFRGLKIGCGCFGSNEENHIGAGSIAWAALLVVLPLLMLALREYELQAARKAQHEA